MQKNIFCLKEINGKIINVDLVREWTIEPSRKFPKTLQKGERNIQLSVFQKYIFNLDF